MRIEIPYENGTIYQHFGHTEQFKVYDVDGGKINHEQIVDAAGSGHDALADFLSELQADALVCGGIGAGAKDALAQAGIKVYGGVVGLADDAAVAMASGTLRYDPDSHCGQHGHEHHEQGRCSGLKNGCGGNGSRYGK